MRNTASKLFNFALYEYIFFHLFFRGAKPPLKAQSVWKNYENLGIKKKDLPGTTEIITLELFDRRKKK